VLGTSWKIIMAVEIVKRWDLTKIRLEARYLNHEPDKSTLPCRSLSLIPPEFLIERGSDGSVQRSLVEPGAILATGIDVAAIRALSWSPTHLLFDQATTGEAVEFPVSLRDLDERHQSARFVVRG
jgi:hypothetical protein